MRRFGLGWRRELGAGIIANLDRVDVVEVMAEDFFNATSKERRALRFVRSLVPVVLHATSLGLAGADRVERKRLDSVARVAGWLEPEFWSEHLAFVRAGGREIGHLAAPPRSEATLAGLERNVREAATAVGSAPLLENVASLIDPPLSTFTEREWLQIVPEVTGCDLLLDLNNLHTNANNFGFSARETVREIDHVGAIHLAGGRPIDGGRFLDDHLHSVPDPVFDLLGHVRCVDATVILERDGNYPPIEELLTEIDRAREISADLHVPCDSGFSFSNRRVTEVADMRSNEEVLTYLAQLFVDEAALQQFVTDPLAATMTAGFTEETRRHLSKIDLDDLVIAARSFSRKRARGCFRRDL